MLPFLIAGAIGFGLGKLFEEDEAPKYADGGLIAPNGKPSNLTPEQYKLVRTNEFKAWFGDWENDPENASKVVDENGEPLVKYRGDNNPKNVFDYINYGGHGVYYFGDVGFAEMFGDKLNSYFINAKNPFIPNKLTDKEEKEIRNLLEKDANEILREEVKNNGLNDLNDFLDNYYLIEAGFNENSNSLDILLYQFKNGINYFILELRPIIEWLKNNDYDGYESYEGNNDNIVVFNSNQIKLADGTNTTFDGDNPDIRFDGGGQINKLKDYNDLIEGYELLLELETNKEKIKTYSDLIDGYKIAIELANEEVEQTQEEMNDEILQNDFEPSYLMTLGEYREKVTPLIQAYKKFLKKNNESFVKPNYYGIARYSLEEALEEIDDDNSAFGKKSKYSTYANKKEKEKVIRNNYSYQKTRNFNDKYTQAPTPPNLIAENKEFIQKLKKYFTTNELNDKIDDDETKSNKRAVRRAIDNETYKTLLTDKKVELSKLQMVAESVGIKLPKSIFDKATQNQMKYEAELGKLLSNIPSLSYNKLKELIEQIKVDLIPLEEQVYEKEYERYSKLTIDNIGSTILLDTLNVNIPMWIDLINSEVEYRDKQNLDYRGRIYVSKIKYIKITSLKSDWENKLSTWVREEVDTLKNSIILAIITNFTSINMPIQSVERLSIKVGYKGFEGSYKFTFENGSSFVMNFQGVGAGGYNIQRYHFRFLTNFSDVELADGSKGGASYYQIANNFSVKK